VLVDEKKKKKTYNLQRGKRRLEKTSSDGVGHSLVNFPLGTVIDSEQKKK